MTIDPQTGVVTTIGQSIDRLNALAFAPEGIVEIPEPGSWSLLASGLMLGWTLRRRLA